MLLLAQAWLGYVWLQAAGPSWCSRINSGGDPGQAGYQDGATPEMLTHPLTWASWAAVASKVGKASTTKVLDAFPGM